MIGWRFLLLEVYCFDDTCARSALEHIKYQQGGFCEGHIGDYLHALGLSRMLREYFAVHWDRIRGALYWRLWRKWTWDEEAFEKFMKEHMQKFGRGSVVDDCLPRCEFPDDK